MSPVQFPVAYMMGGEIKLSYKFLIFECQKQTLVYNFEAISMLGGRYQKRPLESPPNIKISRRLESIER